MLTIHQMAERTGVTIRALRYYDKIGLLPPGAVSPAGYRLYGPAELERLQQILFFRELEFPLAEIKAILASPAYDRTAGEAGPARWPPETGGSCLERRDNHGDGVYRF